MTASRNRTLPRAALLGAVLLGAVLLGGCRLDAEVVVRLDASGGGLVQALVVLDDDLAQRLEDAGVDPLGDVAAAAADDPGWTTRRGPRRLELVRRADGPQELQEAVRSLARGLGAAEVSPLEAARVTVDDDTLRFESGAGLRLTDVVSELGVDRETAAAALREAVDYRVRVELPGEVLETSGRVVDTEDDEGAVVEWRVPVGEQVAVRVVGERPRPIAWQLLAAAGVGVVLGGLLVAGVVSRRRRRP